MIDPGGTTGMINKEGDKLEGMIETIETIEMIKDMEIEIRIIEILKVVKLGLNFRLGIGNAISA
jgi:hypothetical protein